MAVVIVLRSFQTSRLLLVVLIHCRHLVMLIMQCIACENRKCIHVETSAYQTATLQLVVVVLVAWNILLQTLAETHLGDDLAWERVWLEW